METIIYTGFLNDNLHVDLIRVTHNSHSFATMYKIEAWNRKTLKTVVKEYIFMNEAFNTIERLESKYGKTLRKVG